MYTLFPFINGLGCNYNSHAIDGDRTYIGSCRLGIAETITWNKVSGEKIRFKGVLARKGANLFLFVFFKEQISNALHVEKNNINDRFSDPFLFAAKVIPIEEYHMVIVKNPSYRIYKTQIIGQLGFW
ncbi:hypothetical protein [Aeromonas veronii]|uniref:hypothetical protein n=1 Tax=Aeromonas veronii TaxID=654 RepID=UPI001F0AC4B1|nr:hypothetical protein [Aeromonas veronii]